MKKYLFILLLLGLATQAQTVTEKDLLGEWEINKVDFDGIIVNFETNEVTASPGNETVNSSDLEDFKAMLEGDMGTKVKSNRLVFKPGFIFESYEGEKMQAGTYKLMVDNGRQVMVVDTPENMVVDITLQDGLLVWVLPSARTFKMYFKKKQ